MMKTELTKFHNNENIIRECLSFLNCSDLSRVSQTNKLYNKMASNFNDYWKEECNQYFCSNYHNNQVIFDDIPKSITKGKDNFLNDGSEIENINTKPVQYGEPEWREFTRLGIEIKNGWANLLNSRKIIDPILYDDILALRNELYSNLKEFFALTKLRKENHHVENDLNTVLQTYLYDFLYDQQDLYEEYDEIIQNKNYKNVNLPVRKMDLPFANSLQNLTTVLRECGQDRHYETLSKLRWYLCFGEETTKDPEKSSLEKISFNESLNLPLTESLIKIENNLYTKNNLRQELGYVSQPPLIVQKEVLLNSKLIQHMQSFTDNRLIFILNCINLTLTHFCQLSYHYIMQYTSNDQLFLNEYLKRYKSYIDCSIYMNDYLENFNVLVNYAYELSNTKSKLHVFPKFSILRLMILTWNKEVLNKISTENNLLSQKIVNLYSSYLLKDLNKIAMPTYGDSSFLKVSGYNQEDADFDDLSVYSMSTNYSNTRGSISSSLASSSNSSSTNSKNGSSTPGNFIKTAIGLFKPVEEDETIERLIEGICSSINDTFSNEYSVFHINLPYAKTNSHYNHIESGICATIEEIIKTFYSEKTRSSFRPKNIIEEILKYFRNSYIHNKRFINVLKTKLFKKVKDILNEICYEEIIKVFHDDYLPKTKANEKDMESFYKHCDTKCDDDVLYKKLVSKSYGHGHRMISYLAFMFLREYPKYTNSLIPTLKEISKWIEEEEEKLSIKARQVEKEVKRRNIPITFTPEQEMLLSMERAAALPLIEDSMSMLDEMTTEGMFSYDKEDDLEVGNYDLDNLDSLLIGSRYL